MEVFEVQASEMFRVKMEEAAFWLYSHNLERSQEFADKKGLEVQREVNSLKNNLKKNSTHGTD